MQQPKHKIFNGDFIIIIGVIMGFLFTSGMFFRTSDYPEKKDVETTIITQPVESSNSNLQLRTFNIQTCSSKLAVDFLIDNSGSMQFGTKMQSLKNALKVFAAQFPDSGALALQTYSETVNNRLPFTVFKDAKEQFLNDVDSMAPLSATHSKDAFLVAQNSINDGKSSFPNYNFNLIFISDGIPETDAKNQLCPGGQNSQYCAVHPMVATACRCYDTDQDPTAVATQIKNSGIRIFTIAFVDPTEARFNDNLQRLMMDVASSPRDYYMAPIDGQLIDIINQISTRICSYL